VRLAAAFCSSLAEILKAYFPRREQMGRETLLFPSFRAPGRKPCCVIRTGSLRPSQSGSATNAGTPRPARCGTRTVPPGYRRWTEARVGPRGDALVKTVYGHLGTVRHRADVVEYRVEQHAAILRDMLAALRAAARDSENDSVPARPR